MIKKCAKQIITVLLLLFAINHSVFAEEVMTSFTVDANFVTTPCSPSLTIDSPIMDYDFDNGVLPQKVNGYITFTYCTPTPAAPYTLTFGAGQHADSGVRRVANQNNSSAYLPYNICKDSNCSSVWGIDVADNITCAPPSDCNFNFYLRVPQATGVPDAGYYDDRVAVTFISN